MEEIIFKYKDKVVRNGEGTILSGIVNVTPDSFSDGGKYNNTDDAVKRALDLIEEGAGAIDIGGESTRPGSTCVDIQEEINRVVPVIKRLKKETDALISIDTWKADVAEAAIDAGVDVINDITGLIGDEKMAQVIAKAGAGAILMFNPVIIRPNLERSKKFPTFGEQRVFTDQEIRQAEESDDIVSVMKKYFNKSLEIAKDAGIERDRIFLDPGIGFGLTKKENLILIKNVNEIHKMGYPVYLGVSRKRFLVNILEGQGINADPKTDEGFKNRDFASAVLTAIAVTYGVEMVRVHSIEEHKIALSVADSVKFADMQEDLDFDKYKS